MIARYIPDAATASAALEAGEVDWWDNPPVDFSTRLEKNLNVTVFVKNPGGIQGWVRPNHLFPPFNNKKARQALLPHGRSGDVPAGGGRYGYVRPRNLTPFTAKAQYHTVDGPQDSRDRIAPSRSESAETLAGRNTCTRRFESSPSQC